MNKQTQCSSKNMPSKCCWIKYCKFLAFYQLTVVYDSSLDMEETNNTKYIPRNL